MVISDEVQSGLGRSGRHFWAHDRIGLAPDIVTIGKPLANGHPVSAALTTPQTMKTFREAFEYFNTFGGNPVSAAAALSVLAVLKDEDLMAHAAATGACALQRFQEIRHPWLADVRGAGLFFGLEFVTEDRKPATDFVADLVERMVHKGFLMNRIGRHLNTLKLRPPMPFRSENVDALVKALCEALTEMPRPARAIKG